MSPEETPTAAQQQDQTKITYADKEGNEYAEVHGDPNTNLKVTTVAEQKGSVQPNLEGTTPHPHKPQLTGWEAERRGVDVEDTTVGKEEQKTEQKSDQPQESKAAPSTQLNKQAQRSRDK